MEEILVIQKNRKLPPSQDYEFLRKEGMQHIENLSHTLWTDYNTHDPGITILEALCYAITELGYRSRFDMKDLLTGVNGKTVPGQTFFTAKQILTVNPLTKNDYRKLLVDIEGIQNAWMIPEPVNEVPLYADCKEDRLTDEPTATPVALSGLYRVLLSLDQDDLFGDLNNGDIVIANPELAGKFHPGEFQFSIELPAWKNANFELADKAQEKNNISTTVIKVAPQGWKAELTLSAGAGIIQFGITIPKQPASAKVEDDDVQTMFDDKEFIASIFHDYQGKIKRASDIVKDAIKALHAHRNLCEDFVDVTTIDDEQIGFCFDVDVNPAADIEKVQAEIFYAIENYLNPSVHFYSLKELLDKKIPVDDIFSGPVLHHGFIDTLQLEQTNLREVIYASDIINLLMDIEGVKAIRNFLMTKYDANGEPVTNFKSLKWCMHITDYHKPVLRIDRSKILLFKNQFPFIARYDEVRDTVLLLHSIHARNKLNGLQNDLAVPAGAKRDTSSHWPVQYDFPQTYGIGEPGLPAHASVGRKAQQQQLKAYLMFYEQLLADFLSQLSNAHRLYSTEKIKQTYFAQFLNAIKDIEPIYIPDLSNAILNKAISNADSTKETKNEWQQLYESRDLFESRRGRFLDHLLARFAESFNEYALLMYKINYEDRSEEKMSFADMAASKIRTLENYVEISSNRGKAFDYTMGDWDTENVSGLEKRICFLTGIENFRRRFLYCIQHIEIVCTERTEGDTIKCIHTFSTVSLDGIKMVSEEYTSKAEAEQAVLDTIKAGPDVANYLFDAATLELQLIGGEGTTGKVLLKKNYPDKDAAMQDAAKLAAEFSKGCSQPEGLHLIEHILLRPRPVEPPGKKFDLMQVCLHDCNCLCELDLYSFRASVVLPYWPGHFDSMSFREYFENKIREEAPAHVMLKICWLSNELMLEFETAYKDWIEMLAAYAFDKDANTPAFRNANDNMLKILAKLHSEYPQASLHNCDESKEKGNTVVLNKTVLGTF